MQSRPVAPPTIWYLQRLFHSSTIPWADSPNHYETLQIPKHATAREIKRSFYNLSKASHPDHNPNDPDASSRFIKISEAYAVLGTPETRQRYDRDVMKMSSNTYAPHRGSYHSSGPAGGRPANGLSRRRTQFQESPPSFYRAGGWGGYGAKRQSAQDNAAASGPQNTGGIRQQGAMGGGMGYGQHPYGWDSNVPHFDREAHSRTHINHERRRQRRSKTNMPNESGNSMFTSFIFISGILSFSLFVQSHFFALE